jgi:hypothetical protein
MRATLSFLWLMKAEGNMNTENTKTTDFKQNVAREFKEIGIVFLYVAFFFCALSTYSMLLLQKYEISFFTYGTALLNAFVITKVILIGEAAHIGKELEAKPVVY